MGARCWKNYLSDVEPMLPGMGSLLEGDAVLHAYYSGCVFPDWGYLGGINGDASEDSHWRPFHDDYFEVLKSTCPLPWNEEARKRVAFFLGLITHSVTDIPWHFTDGPRLSFENRAAQCENPCYGNYDMACHIFNEVDCGELPGVRGLLWFPYDDILAAYSKTTRKVTQAQLEAGWKNLTVANNMTILFPMWPYVFIKDKYPWARVHYQDYYYGGVEHAASMNAMWMRYWYARLRGWKYFQQMPEYATKPPGYVPYTGCVDAHLCRALPNHNTGGESWLEVSGDRVEDERRCLIRFDLSDIPEGSKVQSAKLWLFYAGTRGVGLRESKTIEVFKVNQAWGGGTRQSSDYDGVDGQPAQPGEVTWQSAQHEVRAWKTAGCDATPEDHDAAAVTAAAITPGDPAGVWKAWDITPLVQHWVGHPTENHGVLLKASDESGRRPGILQFYSSEAFKSGPGEFCGAKRVNGRPILIVVM